MKNINLNHPCHPVLDTGSRATNSDRDFCSRSPRKAGMTLASLVIVSNILSSCSYMPSWMGGREEEKPKLAGERTIALPLENKLVVDAALKSTTPNIPVAKANVDWQKSNSLSGNLIGGKFESKNSATAGDGVNFSHSLVPAPVVVGGLVYAMDSAGIISAHDAASISNVRWKSEDIADEDENEVIGGGLAVDSGVLYASTGQGQVAAFNAVSGAVIWKKNFGVAMRGSPRVVGGKVVVMTIDSQAFGLSAKTGDMLWNHRGINETAAVMNSVSPTVVGEDVLVPYPSGELFALSSADGKELWNDALTTNKYTKASSIFTGIGGDPVVEGSVVFITGNNGLTTALDMNRGRRIWQQEIASINTPWLSGDDLYILTSDNVLVNLVKYTGKIRWLAPLESYEDMENKRRPITWRGPVMVDGKLVVVSSSGQLVFVSAATGKIEATKDIPDNIYTAPVVAGGKLYLVSKDATLYSFQ